MATTTAKRRRNHRPLRSGVGRVRLVLWIDPEEAERVRAAAAAAGTSASAYAAARLLGGRDHDSEETAPLTERTG